MSGILSFADHGQEIILTLHNSSFGSLTSGGGNQVSVFANYQLNDNSISERRPIQMGLLLKVPVEWKGLRLQLETLAYKV